MNAHIDKNRFGPWALVTGASSGIGREFAVCRPTNDGENARRRGGEKDRAARRIGLTQRRHEFANDK